MTELATIAAQAAELRTQGRTFLLATVVRARGSSYRRPGARMLVELGESGEAERWLAGSVSGGCLETDVLLRGAWRTHAGASLVTYDSTSDDEIGWGFGLGCNGIVDVLLERITPQTALDPTRLFAQCLAAARPGALVTVFASNDECVAVGEHLALGPDGKVQTTLSEPSLVAAFEKAAERARSATRPMTEAIEVAGITALVETVAPPPHVFVVGTNHDALPLETLARTMGFMVTVCDTKSRHARRFDKPLIATPAVIRAAVDAAHDARVVLMTHDYDRDRDLLRELLHSRARYVGVLGPLHRTERMLAELEVDPAQRGKLFAPVGLDIGAETPQEIALAIVSEIQATLREARAGFLRERATSIHAREKTVCAVLAAGGSTRLGRPKQLVPFRGEPLVRRVTRTVLASSCASVAVIVGAEQNRVRAAVDDLDASCIFNEQWREGIASSVRAAVAWARDEGATGLVLVLADQPLLTSAHVDRLVGALNKGNAAVGSSYGEVNGVPAAFASSQFAALAALQGDRGAARVLRELEGAVHMRWPEGRVDVDDESDVRALARMETDSEAVKIAGFR